MPRRTGLCGVRNALLVLVWCVAGAMACAGQPKGGAAGRTVLLSTEYDDVRVGREASEDVAAEMGLLGDPALDAYVQQLGERLLRGIPRRAFEFEFRVVDQAEPNAFALPGGRIFVSRGLLALANGEDELANVIGHEITHVMRRHAAAQQQLARRGNPLAMPWLRAASLASYSRDMEREADRGGQQLAAAAGYDPMGMSTFLASLDQRERLLLGNARGSSFFATHPGSTERAAANAVQAREIRWRPDPALGDPRVALLRRVEGLAVGARPENGVFFDSVFAHPDLDFQLRFPSGWRTANSPRAVAAMEPRGDALVYLVADLPPGDLAVVADGFVAKLREEAPVEVKESKPVKLLTGDGWRLEVEGPSRGGALHASVTLVPRANGTWRITGLAPARIAQQVRGRVLATVRSLAPLDPATRARIRESRLRVVTARPGESVEALCTRTGSAWDAPRVAVANGLFADHRFSGGELVKTVQSAPYRSRPVAPSR